MCFCYYHCCANFLLINQSHLYAKKSRQIIFAKSVEIRWIFHFFVRWSFG